MTQFKLTDLIIVLFLSLVAGYFIVSVLVPERVWKDLSRRSRLARFTRHRSGQGENRGRFPSQAKKNARTPADPIRGEKSTTEEPMTERNCAAILGLSGRVTVGEIKAAYRHEIAKYHPDKVTHLAPEFREMARIRTCKIRAAYEYFRGKYGMR